MVSASLVAASPAQESAASNDAIVPYSRWHGEADRLRQRYTVGSPTPHLVLDDFLSPAAAERIVAEFPGPGDGWTHYVHYNERTLGMTDRRALPTSIVEVIDELNSEAFLDLLNRLTGLSLLADSSLEGGGLHESGRDGYVNLHADFTVHPHRPAWRRDLNLLIYLNPAWDDAWGGALQLWDPSVRECVQSIAPRFNRAVLFHTHAQSFHGYPDPLRCPADVSRKALALYYFSEESTRPRPASTRYRGRPGDPLWHRALIRLDTIVLRGYDRAKRMFGFNDAVADRLLRAVARFRDR